MFYSVGSYSLYKVNPNVSGGTPTPPSFADTTSFYYDGVDDFLTGTTTYSELNGQTKMTFSIWIKPTSATTSVITSIEDNGSAEQFRVIFHSSRYIVIRTFTANGRDTRTANASIDLNVWTHISFCLDYSLTSGSRGKIFINGVDATSSDSQNQASLNTSGGALFIGARNVGSLLPFNGNINEVAIWSGVDLRNNIQEIWNSGLPNDLNNLPTAPQPTTWIRSENGTWNGSAWLVDDANSDYQMRDANMVEANRENDVPSLYSNKSFSFDGVDDYVDTNATYSQLDGQTKATFSMWVKPSASGISQILTSTIRNITSNNFQHLIRTDINERIRFFKSTSSDYTYSNANVLNIGQWNHVMICVDLSQPTTSLRCRIFVNNVDETSGFVNLSITAFDTSIDALYIGENQNGEFTPFLGNIDEVAIWSGTDLRDDVATIFNQGVPNNLNENGLTAPTTYYRMGEDATWNGSQWTLNDNGLGGNNGTSQNMVLASRTNDVPLFSTKSILMDGVDDYIDCGNGASLQITGALTLSAWVKMSSTSGQSQDCIISKDNTTQRSYTLWGKTSTSSSPIAYIWSGGTNYSVQATTNIEDDNWHHVMLVYVPSTSLNIYIDGVLEGSNITSIPSSINNASQNFNIGRFGNATFQLDGNIDEVAVWNSDQSANITSIYNNGPNDISNLSPLSWWRMGDFDSYPTLIDRGSGNNNGTMTNMTSASIVNDVPE